MPPTRYSLKGFVPATPIAGLGLVYLDAANVSIEVGDAIFDNGSGYATNVGTAFAATFRGVAAVALAASGLDGSTKVAVIPAAADVKYWVKDTVQLLTQTIVGSFVDLGDNDSIDSTDAACVEWAFLVDEIDVSTLAVAANTYGFALGRFQKVPQ